MLAAQKSTTAEMQQMLKHMERQWNEQRELFEMALSAPHVVERQAPRNGDAVGSPPEVPVDVNRLGRQPSGRPSQRRAPRGRCYRCNNEGHFARDCPRAAQLSEGHLVAILVRWASRWVEEQVARTALLSVPLISQYALVGAATGVY